MATMRSLHPQKLKQARPRGPHLTGSVLLAAPACFRRRGCSHEHDVLSSNPRSIPASYARSSMRPQLPTSPKSLSDPRSELALGHYPSPITEACIPTLPLAFQGRAHFGHFYPQNATRPRCKLTLAPRLFWSFRGIIHHHIDRLSHQDRKGAARTNNQPFAFTAVPLVAGLLCGAPAPFRSCVVGESSATVSPMVSRPLYQLGPWCWGC